MMNKFINKLVVISLIFPRCMELVDDVIEMKHLIHGNPKSSKAIENLIRLFNLLHNRLLIHYTKLHVLSNHNSLLLPMLILYLPK